MSKRKHRPSLSRDFADDIATIIRNSGLDATVEYTNGRKSKGRVIIWGVIHE